MSHDLYSARLYWAPGRGGIAKLHGRLVPLDAVPVLPGVRTVQPYASARRDMSDDEARAADALLVALCRA